MKVLLGILVIGILSVLIIPFLKFTPLQPTVIPSPTPIEPTIKPALCQPITVKSPLPDQVITPPSLTVTVIVNNTDVRCRWTVFEGQAGTLELQDDNQNTLGTGTLTTNEDWTANKPITYTGTVPFNAVGGKANLIITEENPSGQDNPSTVSIPLTY